MNHLSARNVNEALRLAMLHFRTASATLKSSRAGNVIELDGPYVTTYKFPDERVLFDKTRDANPFFHFFEGLWMLAGCEDVEFVSWFNSKIKDFSDDGHRFHGAYGYRWRHHFQYEGNGQSQEVDQLETVIQMLIDQPDTRRAVLCMWDPLTDLNVHSKDIPCNDLIFFKRMGGELRMTICCRSNDAIWGAYGANAVHFSMLFEYVAGRVGLDMGAMTQLSDSLHVYQDNPQWAKLREMSIAGWDPYQDGDVNSYPMFHHDGGEYWDRDLDAFMQWIRDEWNREDFDGSPDYPYANKFFRDVAEPMAVTFKLHKDKSPGGGLAMVDQIRATDWQLACRQWLERRELS